MDAFISGGWRTPARGEVLLGGAWRRISRAEVYRGGSWRPCLSFIAPLSLSVTPSVDGSVYTGAPRPAVVTSGQAVATPTGGAMPYSYSWTVAGGAVALAPNVASTAFRATVPYASEVSGTATVVCTDAFGSTASGQTTYFLYNESNQ